MLANELAHGHRLAMELESQLSSASADLCHSLANEILASIERAISLARLDTCPDYLGVAADSPGSDISGTPPFQADRKKRKTHPKCTNQVKLGSGPAAEGPLDDGHSWRKYGQKAILGAKHPRGYYRCTHRSTQGCPAMKQVQLSDDNPAIFHVTYRGTHTCRLKPSPSPAGHDNQLLLSFQSNLKVETDGLDLQYHQGPSSSPLFFPCTPVDGCFKRGIADDFVAPATPESGFTEMASTGDACMLDLDFLLDAEFPFDDMGFFR